jgi:hypothetical protein
VRKPLRRWWSWQEDRHSGQGQWRAVRWLRRSGPADPLPSLSGHGSRAVAAPTRWTGWRQVRGCPVGRVACRIIVGGLALCSTAAERAEPAGQGGPSWPDKPGRPSRVDKPSGRAGRTSRAGPADPAGGQARQAEQAQQTQRAGRPDKPGRARWWSVQRATTSSGAVCCAALLDRRPSIGTGAGRRAEQPGSRDRCGSGQAPEVTR